MDASSSVLRRLAGAALSGVWPPRAPVPRHASRAGVRRKAAGGAKRGGPQGSSEADPDAAGVADMALDVQVDVCWPALLSLRRTGDSQDRLPGEARNGPWSAACPLSDRSDRSSKTSPARGVPVSPQPAQHRTDSSRTGCDFAPQVPAKRVANHHARLDGSHPARQSETVRRELLLQALCNSGQAGYTNLGGSCEKLLNTTGG